VQFPSQSARQFTQGKVHPVALPYRAAGVSLWLAPVTA